MPLNPNLALVPMQGVQAQGNAIDKMFNTYYQSAGNARQNALLELQKKDSANAQEAHDLNKQGAQYKLGRQQQLDQVSDMAADAYELLPLFESGDQFQVMDKLKSRVDKITQRGGDPSDTIDFMTRLQNGSLSADQAKAELSTVIGKAQQLGVFGSPQTAAIRDFKSKAAAAGLVEGTPEYKHAAKVDLGLESRAGTLTGDERLGDDENMTAKVANSQATIEGAKSSAKETAKLNAQAELLPKIRADIKAAEVDATASGESLTAHKRAKAALPGLQEVVGKLKTLSDVATYTLTGRAFNEVTKQLGFGSTEGGTARVQMRSIVDNQVLPLLRETFGAAFTKAEGDSLRETMLDLDSTPDAKKATLDAFIEQKMRTLETQERELSVNDELLEFMSPEEQALFQ